MEPSVARLLLLFPLVALPVQLCEIPRGSSSLIRSLDLKLLRLTEDLSKEPNPSVYVALRLSNEHSLEREVQYLQRLENAFQRTPSSSVPADQQEQPKTGLLALHLLALRAACQDMENRKGWRLVTQLKHQLHKEKKQIDRESSGRPITNYYQYSLGVLALCVHGKKIDAHVLHKLLNAEKNHRFMHNVKLSVDTEAMAGLAFACLAQTTFYTSDLVAEISLALQRVKEKILQAQTPEGAFGNIFSSPLAVQLLIATGMSTKKPECLKGMAAILGSLEQGQFQNPMIVSQLLPVLHGKSYVDLGTMQCQGEKDTLVLGTSSPSSGTVSLGAGMITIHLIVKRPQAVRNCTNRPSRCPPAPLSWPSWKLLRSGALGNSHLKCRTLCMALSSLQ
uniref:Transcobalamin-2 n=1 Tax=Sphenodon punctatus TaxID=8508 RepID=A0A8D0HL90_SPHPU